MKELPLGSLIERTLRGRKDKRISFNLVFVDGAESRVKTWIRPGVGPDEWGFSFNQSQTFSNGHALRYYDTWVATGVRLSPDRKSVDIVYKQAGS